MIGKHYTYILVVLFATCSFSKITQFNLNQFNGGLYFVQVYEDGCQNCKGEQSELNDASKVLEGVVKVGKINLKNIPAMKGQKLPKNPSYFFVKGSIQDFTQFKEKVTRISICKFVISEIEKYVKSRDSKLFSSGKGSSQTPNSGKKQPKSNKAGSPEKDGSGVIILSDNNFEQSVLKSDEAWFVQFYSPSCGHCHALQPQWDKLPSKIGKRAKIAKIDATVNRQMAQKFQIKGFPTLIFFGVDDKSTPVPYNSQRTAQAMYNWLITQKIGEQKLEFLKLSKQVYDKECNRNIVCLIFILEKKNELKQLDFIEEILEQNKGKPFRFFYSQRLLPFEQTLMIQDRSTPKLVSIWDSLNSYKVYNSLMTKADITQYLTKIMERRSWIKLSDKAVSLLFKQQSSSEL